MEFKHGQGQNLCCLYLAFIIELRISNRIYLVLRICCLPSFAWQLERRKRPLLWRLEQQLYQRLLQSSGLCCTPRASWAETSSGKPVSDERLMAGNVKVSYHCKYKGVHVECWLPYSSRATPPRLKPCRSFWAPSCQDYLCGLPIWFILLFLSSWVSNIKV